MRREIPRNAKIAAILFGLYGLLVLGGMLAAGFGAGEGELGVVALRVLAIWIIAGGLWGGAGWAWIGGLVLPGLWFVLGTTSLIRTLSAPAEVSPPAPALLVVGFALLILAVAWGLLLTHDVRKVYR